MRPVQAGDRVAVPIWVVLLTVFVAMPAMGLSTLVNHDRVELLRGQLDHLQNRDDEHLRQDRIAGWRARCERIAASQGDDAHERAIVEVCMANAAKEEWR